MGQDSMPFSRRLEICYWNAEAKVLDSAVVALESQLNRLGEVRIQTISSLEDQKFSSSDLLIVAAQKIPYESFPDWIESLTAKIRGLGKIWAPALILSDAPFEVLDSMLLKAAKQNWYFDILAADQVASLPIRVANLVRIHDHLRELFRYEAALSKVESKVVELEKEIDQLKGASHD